MMKTPDRPLRLGVLLVASAFASVLPQQGMAAETRTEVRQEFKEATREVKDAWIAGKLETLFTLNRNLNPFDIDTRIENGVVSLLGTVESPVERDLAAELAKSVEGVADVRNELKVASAASLPPARRAEREALAKQRADMRRWVDDATTSAIVKSKLLANQNTRGLEIAVETRNRVVTLSGQVASAEEKQLAELLARNTDSVAEVRNELSINAPQAAVRNP